MGRENKTKLEEIALNWIKFFCNGDINSLAELIAEDLKFKGPLFTFDSKEAYLEALYDDPPGKASCKIINITTNEDSVCVFYNYGKGDSHLTIAQHFKFLDNLIAEILIVFDTRSIY